MHRIISDLSTLTSISETLLMKLINTSEAIICDSTLDTLHSGEKICDLDIGIGNLIINVENNNIKYKFIPSRRLDTDIKEAIISGKSSLVKLVEKSLVDKITSKYQELM